MVKDMELKAVQAQASVNTAESVTLPESPWKRYIGMGLCLLACVGFSLSILVAKLLESYHTFTICLWRFLGLIPFAIPFIIYDKEAIKETIWPWDDLNRRKACMFVMLRGIVGTVAYIFQLAALKYLSIGDSTVITLSTPAFVGLVSWLCLGEKFSLVTMIAVLITFGGIVIIARPPFLTGGTIYDSDLLVGTCFALTSMMFTAGVFILLRYARHVNFAFITASYGVIATLIMVPICLATSTLEFPRTNWDWFLACTKGTLGFAGQAFLTLAAKYERPTVISLVRTTEAVFTYMWQVLLLGILPDWLSFLGSAIVVSGVLLVGVFKFLDQKQ